MYKETCSTTCCWLRLVAYWEDLHKFSNPFPTGVGIGHQATFLGIPTKYWLTCDLTRVFFLVI